MEAQCLHQVIKMTVTRTSRAKLAKQTDRRLSIRVQNNRYFIGLEVQRCPQIVAAATEHAR